MASNCPYVSCCADDTDVTTDECSMYGWALDADAGTCYYEYCIFHCTGAAQKYAIGIHNFIRYSPIFKFLSFNEFIYAYSVC